MSTTCECEPNPVIGRWVEIIVENRRHVGTVIDNVAGTNLPKRIRIQRGYRQGDVVQQHEYHIHQFINPEEVDP